MFLSRLAVVSAQYWFESNLQMHEEANAEYFYVLTITGTPLRSSSLRSEPSVTIRGRIYPEAKTRSEIYDELFTQATHRWMERHDCTHTLGLTTTFFSLEPNQLIPATTI